MRKHRSAGRFGYMTTLRVIDGFPSESLTEATARRLRGQLAEMNISNRTLATRLAVSRELVNRRTKGETSMSAEDMEHIENVTGISAIYLISGTKNPPDPNGPGGSKKCATRDSNPQPSDPKVGVFPQNPNLPLVA